MPNKLHYSLWSKNIHDVHVLLIVHRHAKLKYKLSLTLTLYLLCRISTAIEWLSSRYFIFNTLLCTPDIWLKLAMFERHGHTHQLIYTNLVIYLYLFIYLSILCFNLHFRLFRNNYDSKQHFTIWNCLLAIFVKHVKFYLHPSILQ